MSVDTVVTGQAARAENGSKPARSAGWRVPGFSELRTLGSGGFGDVVLARHDGSGTLVAIKYLRRELPSDSGFAEMFRSEAAVLASMNDPHVVRLHEYVESPSGAAIVMELVDGVSLRKILERNGATTPEAALVVLEGSLLGLAAAHARGVVHRDYKPDNVLVDGVGASKLTDFGMAARSGDRSMPGGTLMYAPPEQFAGGPASPAGDVYAATATFFECLTGRPPLAIIAVGIAAAGSVLGFALTKSSSDTVTPPAVTGVSPSGGSTTGGTIVSVTGTGLADATGVRFGGAAAVITADSSTQVTVKSPPGTGTVTITVATKAGTSQTVGHYTYTTRPEQAQAISFTAPASGTAGVSATLSATGGGSGDPVVFSVDSSSGQGVCTVSGTTVTYAAAGSCVIDANQAGAGNYAAAPQVQQTIMVSAIPRSISPTAPAPGTVAAPGQAPTAAAATPTPTGAAATPAPTTPAAAPTPTQTSSPPASAGWAAAEAPLPADAAANPAAYLGPVACSSASSCVAVGYYTDSSGNQQVLMLTGSGTSWTTTKAPLPADAAADPAAFLGSVACPSASSCVAAGSYNDSSGNQQGWLLTGSGTSWTATEAPLPAGGGAETNLDLVACSSASSCVAAGSYEDSSYNQQGLLLTGSGTSWTATEAPVPDGAAADPVTALESVACPSASSCVAAGTYNDSSGNRPGLLLTGSGTSWTATEAPKPAGAGADPADDPSGLGSVACSSASSCVVAGNYTDSSGNPQGWLLTGSGTSWTATEAPLPAGAAADPADDLFSVACQPASSCVAAGIYTDSSGNRQGWLLTGSGTSWTATEAPLPAGAAADLAGLYSVACPSASSCVAAGYYTDSSGNLQGLLLTGSGTSWTATEPPLPAGAATDPAAALFSVACPSASSCVAAGYYTDSSGNRQGVLISGAG